MQYETVCRRIRDDISGLLLELRPPTSGAAYSAACATRDISDALHHASGLPDDPRWAVAFTSLELFLDYYAAFPKDSAALLELRSFLEENADGRTPLAGHALAS